MKKYNYNPSLRILAGILQSSIKTNVKPLISLGKVDNLNDLEDIPIDNIENTEIEEWLCRIDDRVTNSFICEFSNYAGAVLESVPAFKLYNYIKHHKLIMNSDVINFKVKEFIDYSKIARRTVYKGFNELIDNEILYRSEYRDTFYINVMVIFKGNLAKFLRSKKTNQFYAKLASRDSRRKNT